MPEGPLGQIRPDADAAADIAHGMRVARAIGALDIGQAVVVQQGLVLGVEAIEGTDELLRRCAALRRDGPGGVLVKAEKPGQESRADRPTIGTADRVASGRKRAARHRRQADATIVLDRDEVIRLADAAGLFVVGVGPKRVMASGRACRVLRDARCAKRLSSNECSCRRIFLTAVRRSESGSQGFSQHP